MLLLLSLLACESAPVQVVTRPTEIRMERFCRHEIVSGMKEAEAIAEMKEAEALNKAYVKEVLLKQGWTYVGPIHNDGINCTVTMWTR